MNQNNVSKINDTHKEKNCNKKTIYESIKQDDINSLTKDSPIHLLNVLYQCENIIEIDDNDNFIFNDNKMKEFYTYIFLDKINLKDLENSNPSTKNFISMSNLIHLHNNKQCRI